ncbi:histidine phosphotransferase family protein [Magnetospirillum molischianum]|uniref:Histidine phosphotransferase ChpT C-terminal domain-containing protein n=1 Tax=Magnetospirillum molischianum DSM 120 TaxID=1150626 RepID=H8FRW5_MAGML|nr:histidine phosphotransferase family protein [Magnetospirillum molischianum]CCG41103.1 conserved hypothetical protein [Magnetospirillum molischianum DSM 120]
MDGNDLDLAELLCARLCHDLAGPLGAVGSGAELLGDDADPEMARLVASTAAGAVSRLRLLRAALGTAGGVRPEGELHSLVRAYLDAGASAAARPELAWHSDRPEISGDVGRLLLSLVIVAKDSLPRGGRVSVEIGSPSSVGKIGLAVGFNGPSARLDPDSRAAFCKADQAYGPRAAVACWISRLAARADTAVVVEDLVDGGWIKA